MTKKKERDTFESPDISPVPSDAIRQAIEDLVIIEKRKEYKVNMDYFHTPISWNGKKHCAVCFAGAMLAVANESPNKEIDPNDNFPVKIQNRLFGLDEFRSGNIKEGLKLFSIKKIPIIFNADWPIPITSYDTDKKLFKKDMRELADCLEMFGY